MVNGERLSISRIGYIDGIHSELIVMVGMPRLTFDDLPDTKPCMCGSPMQKEFLDDTHMWVEGLRVEAVRPIPGYGCINPDCGIKTLDSRIHDIFFRTVADYFRDQGDEMRVRRIESEMALLGLAERNIQESLSNSPS